MNSLDKGIIEKDYVVEKIDECVRKSKLKAYDIIKRCIDIIIGLVGCMVLIPIILIVKIMSILNKENGPIFFVQKRIGKNGKTFKFYKFRTMVVNADKKLNKILKENEDLRIEYEENKKMKNDPRITKVGKVLRKTSIDEIPQFINVLKGDMSFVGNRPYLLREKKDMGKFYNEIVKTKPGLTGLWQISGRSAVTFKKRLEIESKYSQEYSLKMDLKIILKTISDFFKGKGGI